MNSNFFAFGRDFLRHFGKSLIFALLLISVLTNNTTSAQTNLTREQFSRLNVRARAAYFENEILYAARIEGVDPNILWTICYLETRFRPWLTSPKNARGLMQFIPATAARFDLENPYEPISAIRAAARYVKVLSNLFGGRVDSILAAYNSGEGTVSAYLFGRTLRTERKIINPKGIKTIGGVPPYNETIGYVGRGLKIYRWLIMRGAFPAGSVRANFPTAISSSVARVGVFDRELGNVPDFNNFSIVVQTQAAQISTVDTFNLDNSKKNKAQNPQNPMFTEVYYDSRSGNRYSVNNGKKTKLLESGIVIINNNGRPDTTNKARSTLFAEPSNN